MSTQERPNQQEMELLVQAIKVLLEAPDLERLKPRLLDMAFEVTGAERGYILLRRGTEEMKPEESRGIEPGTIPEGDPSRAIVQEALKQRKPIISRNATRDPRFSGSESIIIRGIRSACCIPLEARGSIIGAIYLDASGVGRMAETQLPLFEAFGALAALAVMRTTELDDARQALASTSAETRFPGIVGESKLMRRLYERMERIAAADLPVLITGASGTGKELIARALHQTGPRKDKPFRAIFCGNLSPELLESELFGYKKGAFTGAITDKPGLIDLTDKGTLFLDEIGDVPGQIQAKILRFLQDGEYTAIGDTKVKKADARIISATNKDLKEEIKASTFREDLFYRLNVLTIETPPLKDRDGDIPLLAAAILNKVASRTGQPSRKLSSAALNKLIHYHWPGNVRELENVLARAAVLASGDMIEPEDIDLMDEKEDSAVDQTPLVDLQTITDRHLKRVLKAVNGNRSEAARILGVSRRYLQKTLAKWREEGEAL